MAKKRYWFIQPEERYPFRNYLLHTPRHIIWSIRVRVFKRGHKCDYSEGYCTLPGLHRDWS